MLRQDMRLRNKTRIISGVVACVAIEIMIFFLGMTINAQLGYTEIPRILWNTIVGTGYVQVTALIVFVVAWLLSYSVTPAVSFGGPDPSEVISAAACERMITIWENRKAQIELGDEETKTERKQIIGRVAILEKALSAGNYGGKEKELFEDKTAAVASARRR